MAEQKSATRTNSAAADRQLRSGNGFNFNVNPDREGIRQSIVNHLTYTLARDTETAMPRDWWLALCYSVRDRILRQFIETQATHHGQNARRVYYLSLEYLMGRMLTNNLNNSGLMAAAREALEELGLNYDDLCDVEVDMGLGNGGLGRLAACFLDSLATLEYPAIGYGIHYEFGLFRQEIVNGQQVERPDNWLQYGNPWQVQRPEYQVPVHLYGRVEDHFDDKGDWCPRWVDTRQLLGIPWDVPIVGYGATTVNFLRLWESRASAVFDFDTFNRGGYVEAVRQKALGETVSKVLYPNDKTEVGKELRLVQQYFFVCCSLHDIIRRYRKSNEGWDLFPEKVAMQLNDTHPAVAVAELMRIFVDEYGLNWDLAWSLCKRTFGYTNHTLMPEALEKWSVDLFQRVLPRHLQIIYEINRRFLEEEVEQRWPGDGAMKARMSLIEEGNPKMVRMAYLAVVGSHSINGVAAMHTELLKKHLFRDFYELYPERFNNKTNGITPRRWLKDCNPGLASLLDEQLGCTDWPVKLEKLTALEKVADDPEFQHRFMSVKHQNKVRLAAVIKDLCDIEVDPAAIFDVQVKRLHEYKRQHLNLLHIVHLYRRLLREPDFDIHPRVFIFGAKAAPGYELAKEIIHAINVVGVRINSDPRINGKLKVAFVPNYGVNLASIIIPAADVSEQISTAGKEASGTGNMKLALNGAVTIGTLDGANVEIRQEVGDDNIFIFGLTVEEVEAMRAAGYDPTSIYHSNGDLSAALDWLCSDAFLDDEHPAFQGIRSSLLEHGDPYFVLADFAAYAETQLRVDQAYRDRRRWARMAILNTARVSFFSSDRTIREYAEDIWKLKPLPVARVE